MHTTNGKAPHNIGPSSLVLILEAVGEKVVSVVVRAEAVPVRGAQNPVLVELLANAVAFVTSGNRVTRNFGIWAIFGCWAIFGMWGIFLAEY
jgi:hypothetical protein